MLNKIMGFMVRSVFFMGAIFLFILSLYYGDSNTKYQLVQGAIVLLAIGIIAQVIRGLFGFVYHFSVLVR
jgi:hypothetical protein